MNFADRLRELREKAGLSQNALAARAGLHRQAVIKLEAGNRNPTWETVQALAEVLNVSCEDFRETKAK